MASISWENWSGTMLGPGMAGGDAVELLFTDMAINSNAEEMASFRTCTDTRNDQTLYAAHLNTYATPTTTPPAARVQPLGAYFLSNS